jgi:hypothetical protein
MDEGYSQIASMQEALAGQSLWARHCGAASWAVMQTPWWQTVPEVPSQQSASATHGVRQTAFAHSWPAGQSVFAWQRGFDPVSGWHTPPSHTSVAGQAAVAEQSPWHAPLMQVFCAPQSLS